MFSNKIILLFSILYLFCLTTWANNSQDEKVFQTYLNSIDNTQAKDSLFVQTALFFLNTPYIASTLEVNDSEKLVINLRQFDCTTFIENCIALTNTLSSETATFDAFKKKLCRVRYRNGEINGYTSRLHYITDWIYDNTKKGIIYDRTKTIGGLPLIVNLSFMSSHPQSYTALAHNAADVQKMRIIESEINSRKDTYYYIPTSEVTSRQNKIRTGDIIFFTTSIKGLDVVHAGIAYWESGQLSFIHASSLLGKVVVNPDSLADYCAKSKNINGIIVVGIQ